MSLPINISNLEIARGKRVLFSDVSLRIEGGERVAMTGPSGVGKSSLLMALAGLLKPTAGTITIGDDTVLAAQHNVTMMQQRPALLPWTNVRGNIGLGLQFSGLMKRNKIEANRIIDELLERIGLSDRGDAMPSELSGGQQQRVALARALAPSPKVLLLDEPFSALDPTSRACLREDVARLTNTAGVTVVLVTHDKADADALCQREFALAGNLHTLPTPIMSQPIEAPLMCRAG